jgi:hypothetical protein
MLKKIGDYIIPEWALPALINGDNSGLTDKEESALDEFLMQFEGFEGLVFVDSDTRFFCWTNDVDGLGAECFTVSIHGHTIKEGAHQ